MWVSWVVSFWPSYCEHVGKNPLGLIGTMLLLKLKMSGENEAKICRLYFVEWQCQARPTLIEN